MTILQLEIYAASRGFDLYNPEFLWSKQWAPERFTRDIALQMSILESFLRKMPSERREDLFPSKFDLGSMAPLDDAECTYRALADHLGSSGVSVTEGDLGRFASKLSALTGFKYSEPPLSRSYCPHLLEYAGG